MRARRADSPARLGEGTTIRAASATGVTGASHAPDPRPCHHTDDPDGRRVKRAHAGGTTVYAAGGLWEETLGAGGTANSRRALYTLQGRAVAQRDSATNAVLYLHGDHLGSVAVVTDQQGQVASRQQYDAWGAPRGGEGIGEAQTALDFTGQRRDGTGLLYYNARYYDPVIARFASPDTIVPNTRRAALIPLTVDFHKPGFVVAGNQENHLTLEWGFWFQLSGRQKREATCSCGPQDPQALNRYAYTRNNPLRYVDPTGHDLLDPGDTGGGGGGPTSPEAARALLLAFFASAGILGGAGVAAAAVTIAGAGAVGWCIQDMDCRGALIGYRDAVEKGQHESLLPGVDIGNIIATCHSTGCGQHFRRDRTLDGPIPLTNHFRFRLALRAAEKGVTEEEILNGLLYDCERRGNTCYFEVGALQVAVVLNDEDVPVTLFFEGE